MPVFKRRTRIVSFRVSEDEYEELLGLSVAHGARSVSDFARFATRQWFGEDNGHGWDAVQDKIRELNGQVSHLDSEVKRIARSVQVPDN
jgi:hypothetical protein